MSSDMELIFDAEFIDLLDKTKKEAERLNIGFVSTFLILNTLVKSSDTFLSECLKFAGVSKAKIDKAMLVQMECYLNDLEQIESITSTYRITIDETSIQGDWEFVKTLMAAPRLSATGETINEISFILELMYNIENKYINNFFEQIEINKMLLIRYYEGLLIESKFMDFKEEIIPYYS